MTYRPAAAPLSIQLYKVSFGSTDGFSIYRDVGVTSILSETEYVYHFS
jgi:hypothetical protein